MRGLIDRPNNGQVKNFDRMLVELSPHMNEMELDQCIEFLTKIEGSQWDVNPSVEDCKTQLQLILGTERYEEIVWQWKQRNQKLLTVFGTLKYMYRDGRDRIQYDGLDEGDNPEDFNKIYV